MTVKNLRRRLDRLEKARKPDLPVLMLWHDGDDRDIERQAVKARAQGRKIMTIRWQSANPIKLN